MDSVFIFQEGPEGDSNAAMAYDAIVVEQWTIIDVSGSFMSLRVCGFQCAVSFNGLLYEHTTDEFVYGTAIGILCITDNSRK